MPDYQQLVEEDRVHASLYDDPAVFADEMDRVFRRGWVFVGHESEVPLPGDWVTRTIGTEPVILVRDRQGIVHVLANRCSHRGTTLCWAERGNSGSFQCTYHAWTFGLDGALRAVPMPDGFDRSNDELGLDRAGSIGIHGGFVFADMSGEAGPLADHLGSAGMTLIDRLCALSPTGRIDVSAGWIGHRVRSNWKLWPESDSDGYHVGWVHSSMVTATPETHYNDAVVDTSNQSLAVDHGRGHIELDFRPGYKSELAWLGTSREKVASYVDQLNASRGIEETDRLLWEGPPHAFIFPNLFLGEMNLAIVEPIGPHEMVHHHTPVLLEGVDESFNRRLLRQSEAAMGPGSFILTDDAITAERIQAGVSGTRAGSSEAMVDISRGRARERTDGPGELAGDISDETTNRGFWRRYRADMVARA